MLTPRLNLLSHYALERYQPQYENHGKMVGLVIVLITNNIITGATFISRTEGDMKLEQVTVPQNIVLVT